MQNPVFNKSHIKEYFLYGIIASVLYMIPVVYFIKNNKFENFYYIYVGSGLFMLAIFYYTLKLTYRSYDQKRSVSMLIAGHLTTIVGVIVSCILVVFAVLIFSPRMSVWVPVDNIVSNAPPTMQPHHRWSLLIMVLLATAICNVAVGFFISLIMSFAAKQDQTNDKQATLSKNLSLKKRVQY